MAKVHHATLKAAVVKYGGLIAEGKSPEEIKDAIAADDKEFDSEAVEEIYTAILEEEEAEDPDADKGDTGVKKPEAPQPPAAGKKKAGSFTVTTEFRDIDNFNKVHKVGSDVSHFSKDRLDRLVELKYVSAGK
jgi:hypothetical protein